MAGTKGGRRRGHPETGSSGRSSTETGSQQNTKWPILSGQGRIGLTCGPGVGPERGREMKNGKWQQQRSGWHQHHGVAGIPAAIPVAQPQQQQGFAGIHAAITPAMVATLTEFVEQRLKQPGISWRNILNNHNTNRPGGESVNACIADTINFSEVDGGWQATLDWSSSYRP